MSASPSRNTAAEPVPAAASDSASSRAVDAQGHLPAPGPHDNQVVRGYGGPGRETQPGAEVEDRHDGSPQAEHPFDPFRRPRQRHAGDHAQQLHDLFGGQTVMPAADLEDQDLAAVALRDRLIDPPCLAGLVHESPHFPAAVRWVSRSLTHMPMIHSTGIRDGQPA